MFESQSAGVCNYAALQSGYSRDTRFNGYLQAVLAQPVFREAAHHTKFLETAADEFNEE